jgi:hypothetical protein
MPRLVPHLAIAAAAILLAGTASAAPRGDADGDGKLSLGEYQTAMRDRLMRADTDGDGKISLQEYLARPAAAKAKSDPAKRFARLDANGDGFLEAAEIDAMSGRRFAALDSNADGAISDDERHAHRAAARAAAAPVAAPADTGSEQSAPQTNDAKH